MRRHVIYLVIVLFAFSFVGIAQSDMDVIVPNIFTPNNDNKNDVFRPTYVGVSRVKGCIYNRWGSLIFEWQGINGYWDGVTFPSGENVPNGTYFYIIEAYSNSNEKLEKTGTVVVVR